MESRRRFTKKEQITQAIAQAVVDYDAETGELTWKKRPVQYCASVEKMHVFNLRYAGRRAFTAQGGNLRHHVGNIFMIRTKASHLAVLIMTGAWPTHDVRHRNGDGSDDRWENLVIADRPIEGLGGRPSKTRRPVTRKMLHKATRKERAGDRSYSAFACSPYVSPLTTLSPSLCADVSQRNGGLNGEVGPLQARNRDVFTGTYQGA